MHFGLDKVTHSLTCRKPRDEMAKVLSALPVDVLIAPPAGATLRSHPMTPSGD